MRLIDANALGEMLEVRANMAVGTVKSVFYNAEKIVDLMPTVDVTQTISLNDLRDAVYQDAVAHGLWERTDDIVRECIEEEMEENGDVDPDEMMRGWAMEVIRREVNELEEACGEEAYTEELADVIIAALSVAGKVGIDIDAAVKRKMEINKGRPWKHGKEG